MASARRGKDWPDSRESPRGINGFPGRVGMKHPPDVRATGGRDETAADHVR